MSIIGIDLGTSHTVVAVLTDDGPRVLCPAGGSALIPSVVAVDDDGVLLVGEPALAHLTHRPGAGVRWFKRDMGSDTTYQLGDYTLGPTELSAMLLREAAAQAAEVLGCEVRRVVVTVPAYFQEPQRAATAQAGVLAGLEVVRMVNEPTAAAIAHGLSDASTERVVAVIDLGGGTFDVTFLEVFDGIIEVRASGGHSRLGGEDVTAALVDAYSDQVSVDRAVLHAACEEAKCALVDVTAAVLRLPGSQRLVVHRTTLDRVVAPMIERMRSCIVDTLAAAGLRSDEVDEVVLAGGATRMKAVRDLVASLFSAPVVTVDPDRIVALGAAVQGGLVERSKAVSEIVVTDVLSHSLGVQTVREGEDRWLDGYFMPILHRNTTLPVRSVERVYTVHPKQSRLKISVFQGEHRYTRENRALGSFLITDIPPAGSSDATQAVDVAFTHTLDGLLEVEATVVATGESARMLIEGQAGRLSDAQRRRAIEVLESLKVHPRALLPNRLLLERALARHSRLSPRAQALLDQPLTAFEDALQRQQSADIAASAEVLKRALDHPALQPGGGHAPD